VGGLLDTLARLLASFSAFAPSLVGLLRSALTAVLDLAACGWVSDGIEGLLTVFGGRDIRKYIFNLRI
jgi:hypothetical protein